MLVMFRSLSITFIVVTSLILISPTAVASLVQINSGGELLVFDSVTKTYWQADLPRFSYLTYNEQVQKVAQDNAEGYAGIRTWQIATLPQVFVMFDSIDSAAQASLFKANRSRPHATWWEGSTSSYIITEPGETLHAHPILEEYVYDGVTEFSKYYQYYPDFLSSDDGAWVTSGTAPVPIPSAIILLAPGLMALAWFKRRHGSH